VAWTQHFTGPKCPQSFIWFNARCSVFLVNGRNLNKSTQKLRFQRKKCRSTCFIAYRSRVLQMGLIGMLKIPGEKIAAIFSIFTLQQSRILTPMNVRLLIFTVFHRSSEYGWHPSTKRLSKDIS
jgi:hypothetical protein